MPGGDGESTSPPVTVHASTGPATCQDFRRKVLRELKKIKIAWPELNYATAKGVLILSPSPSVLPPPPQQLSLVE